MSSRFSKSADFYGILRYDSANICLGRGVVHLRVRYMSLSTNDVIRNHKSNCVKMIENENQVVVKEKF
jgi:hypothetical protein